MPRRGLTRRGSSGGGGGSSRMRVHWTRVTTVGSRAPAGREGHTASLADNGRVYTFGGLENGVRVAKLECFDLQRHRWTSETCHSGGASNVSSDGIVGGSKLSMDGFDGGKSDGSGVGEDGEVISDKNVPPPRCYHGSWVVGHRLVYFGGEGATSSPAPSATMSMSTSSKLLNNDGKDNINGFKSSQVFSDPATQRRTRRVCFDDVVLYNTIDGTWEVVKSGLAPLPRKGHTCTLVGSSNEAQVVVFGGEPSGKGAPMNDIHTVSVGSLLSGVAMWEKPRPAGDVPAPRHGHTAVALVGTENRNKSSKISDNNTLTRATMAELNNSSDVGSAESQVIVFGGTGGGGLLFNNVFSYGLVSKTWEEVLCEGAAPVPRYGHTAELIPGRKKSGSHHHHNLSQDNAGGKQQEPYRMGGAYPLMVVFGGVTRTGSELTFCRDIQVLDLHTRTWSELRTTHLYPSARYGHAMVLLNDRFEPEVDAAELAYLEEKLNPATGPNKKDETALKELELAAAAAAKKRAPYPKQNYVHVATLLVFGGLNQHYCSSEIWAAEIQMMRRGRETWGDGFDSEMAALGAGADDTGSPSPGRRLRAPDVPASQFEEVNRALMLERKAKIRAEEMLIAERKLKQDALTEVKRLRGCVEAAETTMAEVRREAQAQVERVRREGENERVQLERLRAELDESRHLLSMMDLQGSLRVRAWQEKAQAAEKELARVLGGGS